MRRFEEATRALPGIERKKMFGYPAAFLGGNLFTGLHQDSMIVRLSADDQEILLREKGSRVFEPMPGRPMRGYVVLPPEILASNKKLAHWLERALDHARPLPPKPGKPSSPKAAKKPS